MGKSHPRFWAVGALILLAVIWSYNWTFMKIAVRYASPFDFAAMRAFYGAVCLFLFLIAQGRSIQPGAFWGTFFYGLLQSGATVGLSTWALVSGGAGKTAVLTYTMSFWTLLFAWIFMGEKLRLRQWTSLSVAAVGLAFILIPFTLSQSLVSKGLAILAGAAWATASIVLKKLDYTQPIDPVAFTAWQMLFGSLPLMVVSLLVPSAPVQWSAEFVGVLVYNVVPGGAIAWLLWFYILRHLSTDTASLGALLTPALSIPIAAVQLGEIPAMTELLGMGLILTALVLNSPMPVNISRFKL